MNVSEIIKLLKQKAQRPFDADVAKCLGEVASDVEKLKNKGSETHYVQTQRPFKKDNSITGVSVGGVEQEVEDGVAMLPAYPTKVSELENDVPFITKAVADLENYYRKSDTYTKEEVNHLVSEIPKFAIEVVDALPTTDISTTTIYLLKTSTTEEGNLYTEYIYVKGTWETLGTQKLDLSNYYNKQEVDAELAKKFNKTGGEITGYTKISASSFSVNRISESLRSSVVDFYENNVHCGEIGVTSGRYTGTVAGKNRPFFYYNKEEEILTNATGATKTYVDEQDAKKLDSINNKLTSDNYNAEYNVAYSASSNGKVCLGIFPCYDTNVTIEVSTTTNKTFNGTIVLATQNINTTGGGTYKCSVYGDYDNALTDTIRLRYKSGSNNIAIYAQFTGWSKNTVHIKAVRLKALPTDILTSVSSIPSDATIKATNVANATFALKSSIPTLTSQLTNDSGFVTEGQVNTTSYPTGPNISTFGISSNGCMKLHFNFSPTPPCLTFMNDSLNPDLIKSGGKFTIYLSTDVSWTYDHFVMCTGGNIASHVGNEVYVGSITPNAIYKIEITINAVAGDNYKYPSNASAVVTQLTY